MNKLHKNALAAAMRGGTDGWGQVASAAEHVRYSQPVAPRSRRRCHCGCNQRATHMGMANGCALTMACELAIQRWIKTGATKARKTINAGLTGGMMKVACILEQDTYKPGDQSPEGYLAWHEWAEVQRKAGIKQVQCGHCGLWKTPQELSDQNDLCEMKSRKGPVSVVTPICNKCAAPNAAVSGLRLVDSVLRHNNNVISLAEGSVK